MSCDVILRVKIDHKRLAELNPGRRVDRLQFGDTTMTLRPRGFEVAEHVLNLNGAEAWRFAQSLAASHDREALQLYIVKDGMTLTPATPEEVGKYGTDVVNERIFAQTRPDPAARARWCEERAAYLASLITVIQAQLEATQGELVAIEAELAGLRA